MNTHQPEATNLLFFLSDTCNVDIYEMDNLYPHLKLITGRIIPLSGSFVVDGNSPFYMDHRRVKENELIGVVYTKERS